MQKITLKNGLKVIYYHKPENSVVIEVMVKIGSNYESLQEKGISHLIEHMLFEGTRSRPTNKDISNDIEGIGGEFNAYTTQERTCFYIKVLKKHFSKAVDVLTDIFQNSLFDPKFMEKEKKIIEKEIDMIYDDPNYYQWVLLQQNLFQKHPCRYPSYGIKKVVKNISRKKLLDYFNRNYVPKNVTITVVGDVSDWKKEASKIAPLSKGKGAVRKTWKEPQQTKVKFKKEKKNIVNSYVVLGFKTIPRNNPDFYILEVINSILGRGQSGKMFTEIRGKRGLAYDVGTQNVSDVSYGYFAVYATIDKKNLQEVKKLILKELKELQNVTDKEIVEAKNCLEGNYLMELEEKQKLADQLLFLEQVKDASLIDEYVPKIKEVTKKDLKKVAEKYFKNHTMVLLEGK